MDKEVLIRFIDFLEKTFSRINSKRLMVLYGLLLYLTNSKLSDLSMWLGTGVAVLALLLFVVRPNGKDKMDEKKA